MKNKKILSRAIITLFAVFSILMFSTVSFAAYDYETDVNTMVTSESDDTYSVENMSRDYHDDNPDMGKVIIVAIAVSALVTGITVFIICHSYKTNGMTEPYPYNQKAPLQLTEADDMLVDTKVTKVRINKN